MSNPTIFISYRREGGADIARFLHNKLTDMGMDVFLDVDDLKIGEFAKIIRKEIIRRKFFIVILTPTTLESKWVRREIKFALHKKKNIIPFVTRGFDLYKHIPEDVKELGNFNAIEYDFRNPNIAFDKLRLGILGDKARPKSKSDSTSSNIQIGAIASGNNVTVGSIQQSMGATPQSKINNSYARGAKAIHSILLTEIDTLNSKGVKLAGTAFADSIRDELLKGEQIDTIEFEASLNGLYDLVKEIAEIAVKGILRGAEGIFAKSAKKTAHKIRVQRQSNNQ